MHLFFKQALIFSSTQVRQRYIRIQKVSFYRRVMKCTCGLIECLLCLRNSIDQCFYFIQGALAWNGDMLSSGSRDRLILQRDARTPSPVERRLIGHRQEVSLINGSYASVVEQATTGYLQLLQSWASKAIGLLQQLVT